MWWAEIGISNLVGNLYLYLHTKCHWSRRNFFWTDGHFIPTVLGRFGGVDLTRVSGLSYGVVCVIWRLIVLIQYRCVMDGRTHDDSVYRAGVASRGKNYAGSWNNKCMLQKVLLRVTRDLFSLFLVDITWQDFNWRSASCRSPFDSWAYCSVYWLF